MLTLQNRDSKTKYSGTFLMHLGTLGTLTSIETSKWKWLRQKLDGSLGSMKRGFSSTTSKRSSCSTVAVHSEGIKEQNRLNWYSEHYHLLFGKSTHDARAVITVNKGPMQRKHTNWTG
jgi:hypothetical protein